MQSKNHPSDLTAENNLQHFSTPGPRSPCMALPPLESNDPSLVPPLAPIPRLVFKETNQWPVLRVPTAAVLLQCLFFDEKVLTHDVKVMQ